MSGDHRNTRAVERAVGLMAALACTVALGVPAHADQAPSIPQGDQYGDWRLFCSADSGYCRAISTARAHDGRSAIFKLERSANADGALFVTTAPGLTLKPGMSVEIEAASDFVATGTVNEVHDGNEVAFGGQADRPLITRMRASVHGAVRIDFGRGVGIVDYSVSFDGLEAALEAMDRAQGREGRLDAAVLKGSASPFAKPEEPAALVLEKKDEARSSFTMLWARRPVQ